MTHKNHFMRNALVLMMTFAVMFTYSVIPMNQSFAATAKKPAKVAGVKAKANSTKSIKLTWKKAKYAKKYEIYVSNKAKKGFKKVTTVKAAKKTYTVKKYNKKALKANTKYYFKVRALNGKKKGKFSAVKSATTLKVAEKKATLGEAKTATMSTYIDMSKYPEGQSVKVWVPIPQTDKKNGYQKVPEDKIVFEAPKATVAKITTEKANGNKMLYLEWNKDVAAADRKASLIFTGTRYEVKRTNLKNNSKAYFSAEAKKYINKESTYVKVNDPIVQEYALKATKGKTTTLAKARAIYDWTIKNLERIDNGETLVNAKGKKKTFSVEGCGYGDTKRILTDLKKFGRAGGHCTDINSTFVALCRASGIPAREMFGIRMNDDATGGQHCWAEFYLPGTGWVYADPADVLKAIRPGDGATLAQIKKAKASDLAKEKTAYFWGGVDNNRIVISTGRDITFNPAQSWGKCNTFGYPAAEVNGKRIKDFTNAGEFVYKIDCLDYSTIEKDSEDWKKLGIEYKDLNFANDFVIDVRPDGNFEKGRLVASKKFPVPADYASVDKAGLKALYDQAEGNRVVILCMSGRVLAGNAMQALKESGAYMPNVTYLIGGAKGINETNPLHMGVAFADITAQDYVIDVRTAENFAKGHIQGSVSCPVSPKYTDAEKTAICAEYDKAAGKRIVIVCNTGNALAKSAYGALQDSGKDLKNVTYLLGGAKAVDASNMVQ